jgi:molybdopterin-binding protein
MLEIKNISVHFQSFSLRDVSLNVQRGDYLTVLGLSGAGKTVLLEVLAGLVKPSSGQILMEGNDISRQKIQNRGMGLVYQDLSLFPHLKVSSNIAYGLKKKNLSASQIRLSVGQLALQTGCHHLLDRFPGTLSGGEAQRVALARTLASDPSVLLLDEPLANLDVKLKMDLRSLLRKINESGKTVIHVTHDYMESATLSNRVAVIENGQLIQTGSPKEVFSNPASEFVARFSGVRNLFACRVKQGENQPGLRHAVVDGLGMIHFIGQASDEQGFVMVPQEDIFLSPKALETSAQNQFRGIIKEAHLSRGYMEVVVDAGVDFLVLVSRNSFDKLQLNPGKEIWLSFKASAARFIR